MTRGTGRPDVAADFPALTLVLPGTWVQVAVHDDGQVEQLLELVDRALGSVQAERWRDRLAQLATVGGDQLLVSTSEPASVVVTSWPRESARDLETLLARVERLADARPLPHHEDWPAVTVRDGDSEEGTSAAYLVSDPRTGRVLSLEVSVDVPDFDHPRWRSFDMLVGRLRWDDDPGEEAPDAVHG